MLNFGRKKILKIGKCREWYSEQLLLLELLIKIHSYSSGNRRNFGKMSGFEKKYVVLKLELIFQLWFYSCFFFDSDYLYELFGDPIEPFFRFFVLNGRKSHFLVSNIAKFCQSWGIPYWKRRKPRTFYQNLFDFLTSRNGFWA